MTRSNTHHRSISLGTAAKMCLDSSLTESARQWYRSMIYKVVADLQKDISAEQYDRLCNWMAAVIDQSLEIITEPC